jgi:hypothetical protein
MHGRMYQLRCQLVRAAAAVSLVTLAITVATPARVAAQEKKPSAATQAAREYNFEIRPTVGVVFPTSPDGLSTGWDIGASVRATPHNWPVALQLDLMAVDLNSTLFQATIGVAYDFGSSSSAFRPYLIGGLGLYDGNFGLNAGIGVDFAVVNAPFGFFAEARFHRVFQDPQDLSFIPINAGIRIRI